MYVCSCPAWSECILKNPYCQSQSWKMQRFPSTRVFLFVFFLRHVCASHHGVCMSLFFIEHKQYLLLKWEKNIYCCLFWVFSLFLAFNWGTLERFIQYIEGSDCPLCGDEWKCWSIRFLKFNYTKNTRNLFTAKDGYQCNCIQRHVYSW